MICAVKVAVTSVRVSARQRITYRWLNNPVQNARPEPNKFVKTHICVEPNVSKSRE